MICNCNELVIWLKNEITHLEKVFSKCQKNSILSNNLQGKIEAYSLILECFENEKN
jgi:inorganic pyrophosphatase